MLQFVVVRYLISLPHDKMLLYLGDDRRATLLFAASLLATLPAVLLMVLALRSKVPHSKVFASLVLWGMMLRKYFGRA